MRVSDGHDEATNGNFRHIWLVPLLQALAIATMAIVTWATNDRTPDVLDTTVVACDHEHAADNPTGTVAPCP